MPEASPAAGTFERAIAQHRAGRVQEAERLYREVLARDAEHEQALFLLAAVCLERGLTPEASQLLERLVRLRPGNPLYLSNLGEAQRRLGAYEEAAATLVRAVSLKPDLAAAHFNLGLVLRQLGDLLGAASAFTRAADFKPDEAQIQHALAKALQELGQPERAVGHFQCAALLQPQRLEALVDFTTCLRDLRRYDVALSYATRAVELSPQHAPAHHARSAVLVELERFDEAMEHSQRALAIKPDYAQAHAGLASVLMFSGRVAEALSAYRVALEHDPDDHLVHSNLVYLLAFDPDARPQAIRAEAERWAERHTRHSLQQHREHDNEADPERRLRIGYVSSNFSDHCQALFTLPLLRAHDRTQFELHAYSATPRSDATTDELRRHFDQWHDITRLEPAAAAAQIRARRIDILVDLTMHMATSQLRVFAAKPAPVQIAWLAYPGTTGLPAMDYRISDRFLDPEGADLTRYSERSLILPDTFWCYEPGPASPEVSPLPAATHGYITYGCLNSFFKLNQPTLELWAKVLTEQPQSRLLLLAPEGSARTWVTRTLDRYGVAQERIRFVTRKPRREYLALYHQIDICLDAIPYNGHTTSLDAFWMGVPVLTLVGDTIVGRAGLCHAHNLGLPELVAHEPDEFAAAARALSADLTSLTALRSELRQRLERSALMDAPRFARNLEAAYRRAWRSWCETRQTLRA
jgi:predicted O-linked N-acetylglucosamine transferase (SPINDLY family)